MKKNYNRFRNIALAEGISFLALLLIAMPLKYFANLPMAVTIMGSIHGILFVAFMIFAWEVRNEYKKDIKWLLLAFLDRKSTRLNSSHLKLSRMPSSA